MTLKSINLILKIRFLLTIIGILADCMTYTAQKKRLLSYKIVPGLLVFLFVMNNDHLVPSIECNDVEFKGL